MRAHPNKGWSRFELREILITGIVGGVVGAARLEDIGDQMRLMRTLHPAIHILPFIVLVFLWLMGSVVAQTETNGETDETRERARSSIELLAPLLELERNLEDRIAERNEVSSEEDPEQVAEELAQLRSELDSIQEQISEAATGVSEQGYRALDQVQFDLNTEIESLVEPFVLILNQATSDARQLERTRRDLDIATRRLANSDIAIANLAAAIAQNPPESIQERLTASQATWLERRELHDTQVQALTQRVIDLRAQRSSVGKNVNSAFQVFFRDRSISLLMGFGAFFAVLVGARLIFVVAQRIGTRSTGEKTFAFRLGGIIFAVLSALASFGAMLTVFNMRNDWLLLGLAMLLLLAAIWLALRMLPSLIEQLWVLLNLGAVQERERVLFNGVPFRVERLSLFTDLVNPALDGGEFTLPVRELVGMHSRPAAEDEAWFPSEKGDWVKLADGNAGQVVAQTPEMVVLELLGGAQVTYQTSDYLAATPENLSNGYRVEIEFGIGYDHIADATDRVIEKMNAGIRTHFATLLAAEELRNVDVEFLRAGASSLDYEVEIDVSGGAAHRFEELERELARCMVRIAHAEQWEIPFQQIVVHMPQSAR